MVEKIIIKIKIKKRSKFGNKSSSILFSFLFVFSCLYHYNIRINLFSVLFPFPCFSVTPPTAEIYAGQKCTFKIVFYPTQSNRNFMSEIEAIVSFKSQRTFR